MIQQDLMTTKEVAAYLRIKERVVCAGIGL